MSAGTTPGDPGSIMNMIQTARGESNMRSQLRPALVSLGIFTILTGLVYPLVVTGIAQVVFTSKANGSLLVRNGQPVGSALIGQPFDDPKYFWGRLSATSPAGYTAFNADSKPDRLAQITVHSIPPCSRPPRHGSRRCRKRTPATRPPSRWTWSPPPGAG